MKKITLVKSSLREVRVRFMEVILHSLIRVWLAIEFKERLSVTISEFGYVPDGVTSSGVLYNYGVVAGQVEKTVAVSVGGAKSQCAIHCLSMQCNGYKINNETLCTIYK